MKSDPSITVPLADARNALTRLYPTDAAILNEAAEKLRELYSDNRRLRDAGRDENTRLMEVRGALNNLADEAQILVNIIRDNTREGVCTLHLDMTGGTRKAIEAARKYTP